MTIQTERIRFRHPTTGEELSFPSLWGSDTPKWLLDRGRTFVLVIDDQIQTLAHLSDEAALQKKVCAPFNVEFQFCPECVSGGPLARNDEWHQVLIDRIGSLRDRLSAIFLDLMFDGDKEAFTSSGLRFLKKIYSVFPEIPILILTQAKEEIQLHKSLSASGLHRAFLQKDAGGRIDPICAFLYQHAWVADPTHCAYSQEMRRILPAVRRYAVLRPRRENKLPTPILFKGDSGEGKSRAARLTAKWLQEIDPPLRQSKSIETLDCNALGKDQSARVAIFGKGWHTETELRDLRRGRDSHGLKERGKAQNAANGILIVEEIGNSDMVLQDILLAFVEEGRTQPEFMNSFMDEHALGPIDVLCIFTAQPKHIRVGEISDDLLRRISSGTTVEIPPLRDRRYDALPILYEELRFIRKSEDRHWAEPPVIEELLDRKVEEWLVSVVKDKDLTADAVRKLVGHPSVPILGIPYFEQQLGQIERSRKSRGNVPGSSSGQTGSLLQPDLEYEAEESDSQGAQTPLPTPAISNPIDGTVDGTELVSLLAKTRRISFTRDPNQLRELLERVQYASARILLGYVESSAAVASGGNPEPNLKGTYSLMTGASDESAEAQTKLKNVLLISPEALMTEMDRSEVLARLVIGLARGNRSKKLKEQLEIYCSDARRAERARTLGWNSDKDVATR